MIVVIIIIIIIIIIVIIIVVIIIIIIIIVAIDTFFYCWIKNRAIQQKVPATTNQKLNIKQ